jgi:hypothetical protein
MSLSAEEKRLYQRQHYREIKHLKKRNRSKENMNRKETRDARISLKLCSRCNSPAEENKKVCEYHRILNSIHTQTYYERNKDEIKRRAYFRSL